MIQKEDLKKQWEDADQKTRQFAEENIKWHKKRAELKTQLDEYELNQLLEKIRTQNEGFIIVYHGECIDLYRTFGEPEKAGNSVLISIRERITITTGPRNTEMRHTYGDELSISEYENHVWIGLEDRFKLIDEIEFGLYKGLAIRMRESLISVGLCTDVDLQNPEIVPDMPNQLRWTKNANWEEYNFEDSGKHVAGTVHYQSNTGKWIAGVATPLTGIGDDESDWKTAPVEYSEFSDAQQWVLNNVTQTCFDKSVYKHDGEFFVSLND